MIEFFSDNLAIFVAYILLCFAYQTSISTFNIKVVNQPFFGEFLLFQFHDFQDFVVVKTDIPACNRRKVVLYLLA